ncbi:mitochondrial antiviral-signaling protein [Brachionichthys hirsutus]|uniref:mitochondrial antiviral-signaling protein n=1 Tax=Brachionichthys hirsutus TaxID=412623 RepID=UPI0036054669
MSFVNDKLYKGYLRRNLSTIVSTVKVREIIAHLPCLTDHDKENIEAKREICGNYDGMVLLLDCLKRRENWPEQFIDALEACDYPAIAAEIRREYNSLRGINDSSSPPTTVIRAHVHPAPPASHASTPAGGATSQARIALASPPLETPAQDPQSSSDHVPDPVPIPEPPRSARVEVAPAPPAATLPPPREVATRQEPEENAESDVQDVSGDNGGLPDQVTAGDVEADTAEQYETLTPSCPDLLQPTTTTPEVRPPQTSSLTRVNSGVTNGSSFAVVTPEKPPVQDTAPPVDVQPEETSEPATTQVVESGPQNEAAPVVAPLPGVAGINAPVFDDNSVCMSKPSQLVSIQSQENGHPTNPAPDSPEDPYSGDTDRLEISVAAVTSAHVPACSPVDSATLNSNSALPCQENGIALYNNEPQENHYESPRQSLDTQEVQVHVVQISEQPSVLNLDGQSSTPQPQVLNDEAAVDSASVSPLAANDADAEEIINGPSCEKHLPTEPAPADTSMKTLQDTEEASSRHPPAHTKYILTAAGVAFCALLVAWRFKH